MTPATLTQPARVHSAPAREKGQRLWLGLTCVLVAAAAFPGLRVELAGFLIPIHLVPLVIALPGALPYVRRIPSRMRVALGVFLALFAAAVIQYGSQFGDLVKMVTSILTIVVMASMVRKKDDFLLGVLCLAFAGVAINARGIQGGMVDSFGYQPLQGIGNKNSYSLYALPIVLLAGFVLLYFRLKRAQSLLLIAAILSTAFVLFTGANRSGWGGMVLIAALLAGHARQWRALAIVGGLGLASYGALTLLGTTEVFEFRVAQTAGGYESDEYRRTLFYEAVAIGLENPILGVSVQQLPFELARRTAIQSDVVDPHNFIGYILGGCGVLTLFALFFVAAAMWRRVPGELNKNQRLAHDLLRLTLIVFAVRGFFSREIFFVAAFPIAIGLAIGLMLVDDSEKWSLKADRP